MSVEKEYLQWRKQSSIGCMFARHIANRPHDFRQKLEVVRTQVIDRRATNNVAKRISRLVDDGSVTSAVLLFPDIKSLETLARVFLPLGHLEGWSVTCTPIQNPKVGALVAVCLSREIPFNGQTCPSEALILGPFDVFPPTRKAPVVALEIYVGEPRETDPKTGEPTKKANLAHIDMGLPTHELFARVWQMSVEGRSKSLGQIEDNRAKAKVTFVIPSALAKRLGCTT